MEQVFIFYLGTIYKLWMLHYIMESTVVSVFINMMVSYSFITWRSKIQHDKNKKQKKEID